jgi:hypothetical protein
MAFRNIDHQLSFLERPELDAAVAGMADSGAESRGAVFTRREVVDFILDLAGYTIDKPLHRARLLEPSMGRGDFLTPAIDRLLEAYQSEVGERNDVIKDLGDSVLAVELHKSPVTKRPAPWWRTCCEIKVSRQRRAASYASDGSDKAIFCCYAARAGFHACDRQPALCASRAHSRRADGRISAAFQHDL